jgi:hypothetical protein
MQKNGSSVAIYHTVGRGQRLYPLTASENFNKSALKIPSGLSDKTISVLEAIILQSQLLLPFRKKRLSVFWGDQIFLPNPAVNSNVDSAIDLYVKAMGMPSKEQWEYNNLGQYGFIALSLTKGPQVCEKCSYQAVEKMLKNGLLTADKGVAVSIGTFSLSVEMIEALLEEYHLELLAKKGFVDCDPGWWMPLTLDHKTYVQLIGQKNNGETEAQYLRMQKFKEKFLKSFPNKKLFQSTDIGQKSCWWDYGTLRSYYNNLMKFCGNDDESQSMRSFFQITQDKKVPSELNVDKNSVFIDCNIQSGNIRNSVLVGVEATSLDVENAVIINSKLQKFKGKHCLYYNVTEDDPCEANVGEVRSDINGKMKFQTTLDSDGKEDWHKYIKSNPCSYAELSKSDRTQDHDIQDFQDNQDKD